MEPSVILEMLNAAYRRSSVVPAPPEPSEAMVEAAYRAYGTELDTAVAQTGEVRPGDRRFMRAALRAALSGAATDGRED